MLENLYIGFLVIMGIGSVIFFHELGHFLGAKLLGVKVEEFMLGLPGPKILKFKRGETEYGITWLLLGGYVKLYGEFHEEVPEEEAHRAFSKQPFWRRLIIFFMGPFMNFVFPVVIVAILVMQGVTTPTNVIEQVVKGTPAARAGLKPGDKLVSINNKTVAEWGEVRRIILDNPDKVVALKIERKTETLNLKVRLMQKGSEGYLGISPTSVKRKSGFLGSFILSFKLCLDMMSSIIRITWQIIQENVFFKVVSGPVGIAMETAKAVKVGTEAYLAIVVYVHLFVGMFNILPLPPLDGGRMLIAAIEAARKRPVKSETMAAIQIAGMTVFMLLFLYVITADLQRYGLWGLKLWDLKKF